MSTTYVIPLQNIPQQFEITLGGIDYFIVVKWNDAPDAGWVMDLSDSNNSPLACNIPFITGANLLDGLEYLEVAGELIVYTDGDDFAVPTLTNLGINSNLYFQTNVVGG